MAQARHPVRSDLQRLADRVVEAVDQSADTAEEIHKKLAGLPLDMLEQVDVLERTVKDVRKIQDRSIGAVYGAVRDINHEVVRLAKRLLGSPPARRRARPRKKAGRPAKAVRQPKAA